MIASGLARAGAIAGAPLQQFRPAGVFDPLGAGPIGTVVGIVDATDALNLRRSDFRHGVEGTLIGDTTNLLVGDYLVADRTYFVAQTEPLRPATCILCNRTLSISQPGSPQNTGANAYGGQSVAGNVLIAAGWPASVLPRSHIEIDPTKLPSDVKTAFFDIALPSSLGLTLSYGLVLGDDYGQSYTISSAALALGGWKIIAGITTT